MGQCISHSYVVKQDTAARTSQRCIPEKVEKKEKGRFRWAFSWKSKKTSNEAQQSQCSNDNSQQPERSSDGEAEQNSNTKSSCVSCDNSSVSSWHTCVSSLTSVQEADIPRQEGISTSPTVPSVTVNNNSSPLTLGNTFWKNEEEMIHLSLKGKTGDILQHYTIVKRLGQGAFGSVFEAIRLSDSRKVAIKYVMKLESMGNVRIGLSLFPVEVALMLRLNKGPSVPQIIKLLDWYETPDEYILILERPTPCEDLWAFLMKHDGRLQESTTRVVMQQVVTAAIICCERGVFHSDIKLDNLLINPDTLQVKLIDFGCGRRLKKSAYSAFSGTRIYAPPEWVAHQKYHGKPATVYSLGVLLFAMLSGKYPNKQNLPEMLARPWYTEDISKECRDLISSCLESDPAKRIALEQILLHDWFQVLILRPTNVQK